MITCALLFSGLHSFLIVIHLILDEYFFMCLLTVASVELTNPIYFSQEPLMMPFGELASPNDLVAMMDMYLYMLLVNRMSFMADCEDL